MPSRSNIEPNRQQIRFGNIWIDALSFREALHCIELLVQAKQGGCVFTPNIDHLVTAEDNEAFRAAYGEVSLSLADGQPLIWFSHLLGMPLPEKISGSDLVWPLMELAAQRHWRVYLLGGAPGVATTVAARLETELGVCVVGADCPIIDLSAPHGETTAAVERVQAAQPDLLLVALGTPKQECWIHWALPRIHPTVAIGVGASLDFLAGQIRRAPRWISRAGLEWLFRLAQEPRRLSYRYLVKDPRFLLILAKTAFTPKAHRIRGS